MNSRNGLFVAFLLFAAGHAAAQSGGDSVTFKSGVNEVTVPVVVRDAQGHVVSDLRKEDFTLLDNGKPQAITSFRVEKPGQRVADEKPVASANSAAAAGETGKAKTAPMVIPDHFIAYVFDDLSFREFGDLAWVRDGAMKHMAALQPGDRAAVFSTSCTTQLDFTDDRAKLRETISKLQFRPHTVCSDPRGLQSQSGQFGMIPPFWKEILDRMSTLPGQRSIVFASCGMAWDPRTLEQFAGYAIRLKVVVHTLNARALHPTEPGADFNSNALNSRGVPIVQNPQQLEAHIQSMAQTELAQRLGLSAMAYATGGTFVENTNDADAAYRRLATPDCTYMLGFSPGDANLDGALHHLSVTLKEPRKLSLQARTSYYAATPAEQQAAQTGVAGPPLVESPAEAKEVAQTIGAGQPPPSEDQPITFKARTNLVLVPVVVRDSQGKAVGNLTRDDFQLFDRGKLQEIKQFQMETPGQHVALEKPAEGAEENGVSEDQVGALQKHAPMVIPDRFVALVFDDYHLKMGGMDNFSQGYLTWARDAARRYVATLKPADRVAILTTTGETALDFTSDRAKLEQALLKLHGSQDVKPTGFPSSLFPAGQASAPVFDQTNRTDEWEGRRSMDELAAIVKRMSVEPGQRTMVFLSPGFQLRSGPNWDLLPDTMNLIDHSIQAGVVINTLNVRGLEPGGNGPDELLFRLADGTGGTYVRDRNDYDSALHQLADAPAYRYVLGFSPENLKQDGTLHELKVRLTDKHGLDVQARRAYWDAKPGKETVAAASLKGKATPEVLRESAAEEKEVAATLGIAQPAGAPPAGPLVAKAELPSLVAPGPSAAANAPEMTSHDQTVFQAKVNLVMVPVVVRDAHGQAVGNLTKDNFQLFDKGKRQEITKFTVEKTGSQAPAAKPAAGMNPENGGEEKPAEQPVAAPNNFVAYLFDDVHLKFGDLAQVRDAAGRNIDTLQATDRAAIFTTSGQGALDFTDDRAKLHAALLKLKPRSITGSGTQECPDVSYYMGDLIANKNDGQALQVATTETMICMSLPPQAVSEAQGIARAAAQRAVSNGEHESHVALTTLRDAVRRLSMAPGQRNLILVSPGFLTLEVLLPEELDIVDLAIRSNVRVSSLDARGLYVLNPAGDIDQRQIDPNVTRMKAQYAQSAATMGADVMAEMASGTGGTFIQNTNDFDGGFRRLATAPEYIYMIGFAPDNLKPDGSFHALKVKLSSGEKLSLQARHGYFAPRRAESELAAAREAIDSAVFSREEIHELPVELHTQFFKSSDTEAKLKVLASVDLKMLQFRKDEGRNRNDLTVVSALFDNNGNFVTGMEKILHMRLLDTTMARLPQAPPIKVTSEFDVKPGNYLIRLVVRDAEGHLMATENGAVEIP
jgi:VWFA-related protein